MNIVLINSEYTSLSGQDHGGIATYVYTMANALGNTGQRVYILARKGTVPDNLNENVKFFTFNFTPVLTPLSFLSRRFNSMIYWEQGCSRAALEIVMELHKKSSIDIVEIPEYNGIASQFFNPLPFSLVINFHSPTMLIDKLNHNRITQQRKKLYVYEKKALKNATAFKCPSESLTRRLMDIFSIDPKQVKIIPNPISTHSFDVIEKKRDTQGNRCNILFSGRLERRKGAEIILRTINNILDINRNIHLSFAGETEMGESVGYRQAIERSLKKENRDRIWFLGPMNRARLALLYCRSDIFFMPSLFENSPYTLLEAMAAKLPVVAADTGGINEIIEHKKNGFLFSLNNLDELYVCLKELVNSVEQREKIGKNAYEYVKTHFSPETIARQTIEFYKEVKKNKAKI